MDLQTKTKGTVTIEDTQRFFFAHGLFGFETCTEFALIEAEYEPFFWLQSMQEPALAFLTVDPFLIRSDYELDIDDKNLGDIGITNPSDVTVLAIVTLPKDGRPVTVNLQGPLVVNKRANKGFQAVLSDPRWHTKHIIEAELQRGASC
jgi:flagellar assembly factor FliW